MLNVKPIDTPYAKKFHPTMYGDISEEEKEYMSRISYARIVGSLMYGIVRRRLDLAHAVSVVSKFMVQPGKEQWIVVKKIPNILRVNLMLVSSMGPRIRTWLHAILILIM